MKKFIIAAALATTAIGGVAIAAQMEGGPRYDRGGGAMARADANHDGTLTREEALAAATERFDKIDANHDGKITAEERKAAHQAMRERWMGGQVGREWRHGLGMGHRGLGGPGGPGMDGPGWDGPGMDGPGRGGRGGGPEAMLARLDTNQDGKISREEFIAPMTVRATGHFDRIDANHDGFVDKAEMDAARAQMRARMEQMRDRPGQPNPAEAQPNTGK